MINTASTSGELKAGRARVDLGLYRAWFEDRLLDLTGSQVELLAILIANRTRVLSRPELAKALHLDHQRSVDVMLSILRKAIGRDFVRNVRGRGWIIIPEALGA